MSTFKTFAFRCVLPLSLLIGAFLRPSFISLCYLVLSLLSHLFPPIRVNTALPVSTRFYLSLCLVITFTLTCLQFAFQLYNHLNYPDDATYVKQCEKDSDHNSLFRFFGLTRVPLVFDPFAFILALPEIVSLLGTLFAFITCIIYSNSDNQQENPEIDEIETDLDDDGTIGHLNQQVHQNSSTNQTQKSGASAITSAFILFIKKATDVSCLFFVCLVGIINPSVLNLVYFLLYLTMFTWWALFTPLRRSTLNTIKKFLIFYSAFHILIIFAYQIPTVQQLFNPDGIYARVVGLVALVQQQDCTNWWKWRVPNYWNITGYLNTLFMVLYFHVSLIQYKWTKTGTREPRRQVTDSDSGHEQLIPQRSLETETSDGITMRRMTSRIMDRQKISQLFNSIPTLKKSTLITGTEAFLYFCLYHCYVFALLALMTWALMFHSIFGLILLFIACFLWAFADSRKWSFTLSPFITLYIEALLLVQYVFSFDLRGDEFFVSDYMKIIGFELTSTRMQAFTTLCIKVALSIPIFVLLRLYYREKFYDSFGNSRRFQPSGFTYGTFPTDQQNQVGPSQILNNNQNEKSDQEKFAWVSKQFAKVWIFIVVLFILLNAFTNPPVLYAVGYFLFFSILVLNLHLSFFIFRRTIFFILTLLIIYSSIVLIAVYCYQFDSVPQYWEKLTGTTTEWNNDIGLVKIIVNGEKSIDQIFKRLILPISLLVVTLLQLKFFHEKWMKMVEPISTNVDVEAPDEGRTTSRLKRFFDQFIDILYSFAEVHGLRIILVILVSVCSSNFCLMNFFPLLLAILILCIPKSSTLFSLLLCIYLSAVFIARRVYQLHFIHTGDEGNATTCSLAKDPQFLNLTEWIGFRKDADIPTDLLNLVILMALIGLYFCVQHRQKHHRASLGLRKTPGIIFPEVAPEAYDSSISNCIKCFYNYGFYKFGLEISLSAIVFVAWVRMDLLAAALIVWLALFVCLSRPVCRALWPLFLLYLTVTLSLQYLMAIGLPYNLCIEYPWMHWISNGNSDWLLLDDNLSYFLDLANYRLNADRFSEYIVADFILLLVVACQEMVFRDEGENHPAGDNQSIYKDGRYILKKDNPRDNFIAEQKSHVDFIKCIVFMYGHWITLIMVLCAGLGGTSLFALGYMIFALLILWNGNNLYTMRSYKSTLARWKTLVIYNVFAMLCKISLQVLGCAFITHLNNLCILQQLFSIICVKDSSMNRINEFFKKDSIAGEYDGIHACQVQESETRIGFDLAAFIFIIFQLRILNSWYFQRCIVEFRCEVIQANRGAILINQLVEKEMKEQNEQQRKKFNDIKVRTAAIRQRYEEQQRRSVIGLGGLQSPNSYAQAKRAGDYYMFDYDPSDDQLQKAIQIVPEVTPGATDYDKLDPVQLLHTALGKDLDLSSTLEAVAAAETIKDEQLRMIAAVSNSERARQIAQSVLDRRSASTSQTPPPLSQDEIETTDFPTIRLRKKKSVDDEKTTDNELLSSPAEECANTTTTKTKNWLEWIYPALLFSWKILMSALHWIATFLNRRSREHRYVSYVLNKEKERLMQTMGDDLYDARISASDLRQRWESREIRMVSSEADILRLENEAHTRWEQKDVIARLAYSIGNCISAHTDLLCYFFAILAHARCAGLITLPLPLLVFFWGTLSNPRPSKTFWITLITYTEIVICVKFIFQFGFWPWNTPKEAVGSSTKIYKFENVLGIQRINYFATADVALLIALFFHRYMLRKLGLWKDANVQYTDFNSPVKGQKAQKKSSSATQHSSPETESTAEYSSAISNFESPPNGNSPSSTKHGLAFADKNKGRIAKFVDQLLHPRFRYIRDLYPAMFFLDVACFLIVAFNYTSFAEGGSGNFISYIKSNRVPLSFVLMLMFISFMIIIDRGLYLRKAVYCKLIYQLASVIFIHVWIFFILPAITKVETADNSVALFLYIVKCIYFIVSAWQIRNGYPPSSIGNMFTNYHGLTNLALIKCYPRVPFLQELKSAIDWMLTRSTMPIFEFITMDNYYTIIYDLKCMRKFEETFPAQPGEAVSNFKKCVMGIPIVFVLIIAVWCPLLIYSFLNQTGEIVKPEYATLTASIEGYPPLYIMHAQGNDLMQLESDQFTHLLNNFADQAKHPAVRPSSVREAVTFINEYTEGDVLKVNFRPGSEIFWQISDESLEALTSDLSSNKTMNFNFQIVFKRPMKDVEGTSHSLDLSYPLDTSMRSELLRAVIAGEKFTLNNSLPMFLRVPSITASDVEIIKPLQYASNIGSSSDMNATFSNWTIELHKRSQRIWEAQLALNQQITVFLQDTVKYGPDRNLTYVQVIAFVDRVFPEILADYVKTGIVAMYIAVVILIARTLRSLVASQPLDVIINEIPNPDYLMKMCQDIYLVREGRDFELEQDLFAKLIFLFRSPATLIKWTRYASRV